MTVITMTREMGTLGKDVALGLSEKLGIEVVHHQLVEADVASRLNMDVGDVHRFLEGNPSLIDRWRIDGNRLSRYTAEEILKLADKGKVLIRGWGAAYLLKDVSHVLRIRVCAPEAMRIGVIMKRLETTEAVARREIERNDAAHTRTMRRFFDADWKDPINYHLVLNTALVSVDACVDQIVLLAKNPLFKETRGSRSALADKLMESKIRVALDQDPAVGAHSRGFDIEVKGGNVRLAGACELTSRIAAAGEIAGQVGGVKSVQNDIVLIEPHFMG